MNKKVTILKIEPHKEPEVIEVEDTLETYHCLERNQGH